MPPTAFRRAVAMVLFVAAGALSAGCERKREGAVRVLVIGETPKIVDPAARILSPSEAVLLNNVAQGLVRFDARGHVEPGLAERWNVSDDGLSYIFRLASGEWSDGGKITARQVARILRQTLASKSNNPLKDTLGAIDEIVPMTDRVLEVRLTAPRPNLLQLLAQPEFALVREGQGSGPFRLAKGGAAGGELRLERRVTVPDGEEDRREELRLLGSPAPDALRRFLVGEVDLVLGGTFADLPFTTAADLPRNALRFDPVAGLFGLAPTRRSGPLADA